MSKIYILYDFFYEKKLRLLISTFFFVITYTIFCYLFSYCVSIKFIDKYFQKKIEVNFYILLQVF
jgi:hypothetical protein